MSKVVGVDTNWLVAIATIDHPVHQASEKMWNEHLNAGYRIGLTPLVMAEFLHVVTDSRRFREACTMEQALDLAEVWWQSPDVERLYPITNSLALAFQWMRQHQLGRKRVLDTQLAAIMHVHGVSRLLTTNPSDYKIFCVFELLEPESSTGTKE